VCDGLICELYSDPRTGVLALIFELMDMNVYELIKGTYLNLVVVVVCLNFYY